jgi:multidrug efflux pump subunit AcrB
MFQVAQYESWTILWSVILSVAVAALGALLGLMVAGIALNVYAQVCLPPCTA